MSAPLRITVVEIDGTVTRPVRFGGPPGEALAAALREAMLKRGCLRDRDHKGQCLNCALLPQCAVWPSVAPADPTQRQRGPYLRPFILRLPEIPPTGLQPGARVTYGATIVQDTRFPALWGTFAAAFVQAARQIAEWGFGLAVREGEQAARRGAISVGRARWLHPVTGETQPYAPPEGAPESPPLIAEFSSPPASAPPVDADLLTLTFVTPTRLVAAGISARHPEPVLLFRRVAERLDAVAASVGADEPRLLADENLTAAAERLQMRDDGTVWVGDTMRGGFVGPVTLAGDPGDLGRIAPVFRWGAALGVGKGTLHGAGRFVVGPVPETARVVMTGPLATPPKPPATTTRRESSPPAQKRPPLLRKRTHKGNRKR